MDRAEAAAPAPATPRRTFWRRARQAGLLTTGAAVVVGLIWRNDGRAVFQALAHAPFRALAVVAAHLPETLLAAIAWRALMDDATRLSLARTFRLRLVKEAVNALLPVAQVGGDVVRVRLAHVEGMPLRGAAATALADVAVGLISLVAFATAGVLAVLTTSDDAEVLGLGLELVAAAGLLFALVAAAGRFGLVARIDAAVARMDGALGRLAGLGEAVTAIMRQPRKMIPSMIWHLMSWGLGVLETSVAFWAIGLPASFENALILESLGQAVRGLGFAVPAGLGVQEGGYILICHSLGIAPPQALALSLLRRGRELTLGLIGLSLWRVMARRTA